MHVHSDRFVTSSSKHFCLAGIWNVEYTLLNVAQSLCPPPPPASWLCVQVISPDVWGKTGICWFITWLFTALRRQSLPFTVVGSRTDQNLCSVLLAALLTMKWNKFPHEKRDQVWNGIGEDLEIWKMSQAKPIAQTWLCSGGQGRWPAVGWWRKRPGRWNLCRALRLPHPTTAEPLQAVGTYTLSLDTPALNGSSHRWTGSLLQSHTCGRDTNTEAPFIEPDQDENVLPLFCLPFLYRTFEGGMVMLR